jgi:DNA-binding CsgD family transcriptional regulator
VGFGAQLREACTLGEIVAVLEDTVVPVVEQRGVAVELLDTVGRPACAVTNLCDINTTRIYMIGAYQLDPTLAHILRFSRSILSTDLLSREELARRIRSAGQREELDIFVASPLPGVGELVGTVRFVPCGVPTRSLRHDLERITTMTAVRLAQLGFRPPIYSSELARLTVRQRRIAVLASRGYTNLEIGDELGISVNTVKKALKLAFASLGLSSRAELASLLARSFLAAESTARLPAGYHALWRDFADQD